MNQVVTCQSESLTECAMIRERMVAGVSNDIPACEIHGAWTDDAEEFIPSSRDCPGCGRIMSEREASEQGSCNDCRPEAEPVASEFIPEPVKRWDDPNYWKWVRVGHCRGCGGFHVLREDRCWTCEQVAL